MVLRSMDCCRRKGFRCILGSMRARVLRMRGRLDLPSVFMDVCDVFLEVSSSEIVGKNKDKYWCGLLLFSRALMLVWWIVGAGLAAGAIACSDGVCFIGE